MPPFPHAFNEILEYLEATFNEIHEYPGASIGTYREPRFWVQLSKLFLVCTGVPGDGGS